jgi:signal transduction histidine kinase
LAYWRAARSRGADSEPGDQPVSSDKQQESIKRRVIRLVLIPSAAALAISLAASAYLVWNGFYTRAVAISVREVSIPAVSALASIQQERRLSVIYLTQPSRGLGGLLEQREQTEQRLATLRTAAEAALGRAPESITSRWQTLTRYLDRLPTVRSTVDSRSGSRRDVTTFYDSLLAAATDLFDTQARVVPDVTAAQGGLTATDTFRASDAMSRAGSVIDGALGLRALSQADYLQFVQLVGTYHTMLATIEPHLQPGARQRYEALTTSGSWRQLSRVEQSLTLAGTWRDGTPRSVSITRADWEALTQQVSLSLTDLTVAQADEVSARALTTGDRQLTIASLSSAVALLLVLAAAAWAVRQSQILVDRSLSVRLDRLARDAAEVVDERLPAIMGRLSRGEQVDLRTEMPAQRYGGDEIGRVGRVIQQALQAAVRAAADQAALRQAAQVMLRGVARRPQLPLQAALMVVTEMQRQVGDAEMLAQLFDAHHKLAQTRRFLENLLILSGGQVGRKFRTAVPVRSVIKAAQSESRDYERVAVRNVPDVVLAPQAVTDVLHLLAELIDNALQFSPPGSEVTVTCTVVENGVAVEIEDRGVGMRPDEVRQRNELLATAPTPDVTALKDGSTIGLYVVAELARREGVQVTLRSSAYGGTLAIVLLPKALTPAVGAEPGGTGREPELIGAAVAAARVPAASAPQGRPAGTHSPVVAPGAVRGHRTPDGPGGGRMHHPHLGVSPAGAPHHAFPTDERAAAPAGDRPLNGERPKLPKRTPQSHLATGLRTDSPAAAEDTLAEIDPATAVETSLVRFARFRNNLHAGASALDAPDLSDNQGNA